MAGDQLGSKVAAVATPVQTQGVETGEYRREVQQINYSLASDQVKQVLQTFYHIYCEGSCTDDMTAVRSVARLLQTTFPNRNLKPYVAAIASTPQKSTRIAGLTMSAQPLWAPSTASAIAATANVTHSSIPGGVSITATSATTANVAAAVQAACSGFAREVLNDA